jgi:hypothetical protein
MGVIPTALEKRRMKERSGADTYTRLQKIKHKYDPGNLFRMNQNIDPRP